jgi:hypothetical protein
VISRTRARVINRAPDASALGQYVMSVLALAPIGQPRSHGPQFTHARRPS